MATNLHMHEALKVSLPVPTGTPAGTPVKVGSLVGVTVTAEGEGGNLEGYATVWRHGAWDLEVAGAITSIGAPVYITGSGLNTAGDDLFGYALATKTAAAAVIPVALAQV